MTSEWITALSTFVYVFATIFIVVWNKRIASATQKQVNELQRQFQEQNRPHICVQIEDVRGGLTCLSIENTGSLPADDLHVSVNQEFTDALAGSGFQERLRKLTEAATYLSPKQKLYCCLGGPDSFQRLREQPIVIDVSYCRDGREYADHIEIDLNSYGWALIYDSPLGDISTHVKKLSETLDHIAKRFA